MFVKPCKTEIVSPLGVKDRYAYCLLQKVRVPKFKVPSLQHNRHHVQVLSCPLHVSLQKLGLGEQKMLINWLLLLLCSIKFFVSGAGVGAFCQHP